MDSAILQRTCQVATARRTAVDVLVSAVLRLVTDSADTDDPVLGSMHHESEVVDQMLAFVMKERERRWLS